MKKKPKYHFKNYTSEEWSAHQKETHSTKQFKKRQSASVKEAWKDPKTRKRMLKSNLGSNESRSKNMTKQWQDPVLRKKRLAGIRTARRSMRNGQNKTEARVETILKELGYSYIYTGSSRGTTYSVGPFYPDFVHTSQKRIIEVFSIFWHNTPEAIERDARRMECFKRYDYKVLIVWDHEIKDADRLKRLKERIIKFHKRK